MYAHDWADDWPIGPIKGQVVRSIWNILQFNQNVIDAQIGIIRPTRCDSTHRIGFGILKLITWSDIQHAKIRIYNGNVSHIIAIYVWIALFCLVLCRFRVWVCVCGEGVSIWYVNVIYYLQLDFNLNCCDKRIYYAVRWRSKVVLHLSLSL